MNNIIHQKDIEIYVKEDRKREEKVNVNGHA